MTQISGITTGNGLSSAIASGGGASPAEREQLAKAAKAFEAIIMRQLVGAMRSSSQSESIDGSSAVDQFRELADAGMADNLAERGGLGIAQMLLDQLDKR